ncbi:MAG: PASTA domain-containing protein [Christensenellaceae bacterium]|nr:PASTA domain-containing protein [Christensenellaceae bacterium]
MTFSFVALICRLIYIEVITGNELSVKALDQWWRDVPITAKRGDIYDRNGVLLAGANTAYTLYIRPSEVKNKQTTAQVLSEVLDLTYASLIKKLESRQSEIKIKSGMDKDEMLKTLQSRAEGIYFSQTVKRVYPYADFMAQTLGFVNADVHGQTGLESKYDVYLSGVDGYILTETDLVGRRIENGITRYLDGTPGHNAHLTIDYNIQKSIEDAVKEAYITHSAKSVSCIMMDVETGEILGMAQAPSFDLNNVPRSDPIALLANSKCTWASDTFEPGSTFKILTAAIGLDSGAITTKSTVTCPGYHVVDGQKIKCWRTRGHGTQSFSEAVANSCNVMFMNIASKTGISTLYDYFDRLGLDEKTGIDIVGEASGILISKDSVKNVDLARIGFGQSIAITPIELLVASAIVVNGGTQVRPYILDYFADDSGKTVLKNYPITKTGIISSTTSKIMREVLENVVVNGGGKNAAVSGYRIGGKTGTAQKYENGAIARGKYISTFIGFAPADAPKYICLIVVDEPVGAYYGSIVAAPYVGKIFSEVLPHVGIASAFESSKTELIMPSVVGLGIEEVTYIFELLGIYIEVYGEGNTVTKQSPIAGTKISSNSLVAFELDL